MVQGAEEYALVLGLDPLRIGSIENNIIKRRKKGLLALERTVQKCVLCDDENLDVTGELDCVHNILVIEERRYEKDAIHGVG